MKKSVFFLFCIGIPLFGLGQSTKDLVEKFKAQNQEYQRLYDARQISRSSYKGDASIEDEKSRLAGFAGSIPVFLESDDMRANRSANVVALQNGSLEGLNNQKINGAGMNILVMDEGKIFEKHVEFGADNQGNISVQRIFNKDTEPYSSHATNVAGIIGAIGVGNFADPYGQQGAKGILTNVDFDSYSFRTTYATNYVKLTNATSANISNHSYGINFGWTYKNKTSNTYPYVGYYWVGNYELNAEDTYSGSYGTQDENFDRIVYNNPNHVIVKSAGNYYGIGPNTIANAYKSSKGKYVPFEQGDPLPAKNCSKGYYCIGWGSLAKNIIVVGATNQLTTPGNVYTQSTDVVKASYSSAGPRRDGAIKPDISAVGSNHMMATYNTNTEYDSYTLGSGTSYAAPGVSGVAGAITQVNRNLTGNSNFIYRADEMKAILTHTANEAGHPGPDVWFGWGFVDATKAAQLIIDVYNQKAILERNNLTSGSVYTQLVKGKEGESIKASLSWIDPPAKPFTTDYELQNNHSSKLVNDLDLRIIDTETNKVYYPWKLDVDNPMANATKGDNLVDNIEQVVVDSPVNGRTYRIEVSNKGNLIDDNGKSATQAYTLIISGYGEENLAISEATEKGIAVYPSRTKDIVNVLIPQGAKSISIFDMSGKQVLSLHAKSYQTIDLGNLPKGIYIFNIVTDQSTITKKVIKE